MKNEAIEMATKQYTVEIGLVEAEVKEFTECAKEIGISFDDFLNTYIDAIHNDNDLNLKEFVKYKKQLIKENETFKH